MTPLAIFSLIVSGGILLATGFMLGKSQNQDTGTTKTKRKQYDFKVCGGWSMATSRYSLDVGDCTKETLNELGAQGWQLVGAWDDKRLYFQREVQQDNFSPSIKY